MRSPVADLLADLAAGLGELDVPWYLFAQSEKDTGTGTLENRLWAATDQLRANSGLTSAQYSQPVLTGATP